MTATISNEAKANDILLFDADIIVYRYTQTYTAWADSNTSLHLEVSGGRPLNAGPCSPPRRNAPDTEYRLYVDLCRSFFSPMRGCARRIFIHDFLKPNLQIELVCRFYDGSALKFGWICSSDSGVLKLGVWLPPHFHRPYRRNYIRLSQNVVEVQNMLKVLYHYAEIGRAGLRPPPRWPKMCFFVRERVYHAFERQTEFGLTIYPWKTILIPSDRQRFAVVRACSTFFVHRQMATLQNVESKTYNL